MATVTRSTTSVSKKAAIAVPQKLNLSLPFSPEEATGTLETAYVLLHGEKKIGKTSLAVEAPGAFLLTFDPKQKFLGGIMQRFCPDWTHFLEYLKLLEELAKKPTFPYTRIVLDGVDIWWRHCEKFTCREFGVKDLAEEEWGKGFRRLKVHFSSAVDRLMALPCGSWYISHSVWRDVPSRRTNSKITKLLPTMASGAEEIIVGRVDGWFAYDFWGEERILIVRGDEQTGAGNRMKGHFQTPKGRPVREVSMGSTETEAWENLTKAFNNQQRYVTLFERDTEAAKAKKGGAAPLRK